MNILNKLKEKYGIEFMPILFMLSGLSGIIMGLLIPQSDTGLYWGTPFMCIGIFGVVMDMRKHKKEQQNNTTSL